MWDKETFVDANHRILRHFAAGGAGQTLRHFAAAAAPTKNRDGCESCNSRRPPLLQKTATGANHAIRGGRRSYKKNATGAIWLVGAAAAANDFDQATTSSSYRFIQFPG